MGAPNPSSSPGPRLVSALIQGELPPVWTRRLSLLGVLGAVCFAVALLAGGSRNGQQIPNLTREDLGRPFQAATAGGFKAARDFSILDVEGTDRRRAEARAAVRPVYDLNPGVHEDVRTRVRVAFEHVRRGGSAADPKPEERGEARTQDGADPHPSPPAVPADGEKGGATTLPASGSQPVKPPDPAELREAFETALFGVSGEKLQDSDHAALARADFSVTLEEAIVAMVAHGFRVPLISSREELGREAPQGLTIRNLRDRKEWSLEGERSQLNDLAEARQELERFASVPGNVLPDRPGLERRAAMRLAQQLLRPDLTINAAETELRRKEAERAVKEAVLSVKKGQRILGDGELINELHLQLLSGMRAQAATGDRLQLQVGSAGLAALLVGCAWLFCLATFRRWRLPVRDAVFLGLTLVGMLGLSQVWMTVTEALRDAAARMPVDALPYAIPVAGSAMLVRFVLDSRTSLFFALVQSALVGVLFGTGFAFGGYALAGSLIGMALISRVQDRTGILRAGLITGGVNGLMVIFLHLAEGKGLGGEVLSSALVALIGTAMTVPVVVMAATPVAELLFGYASDVKLLELANLNHPALKELIVQAPGTYHHSIIMGTLVENAASAIGANPLLARTCAYYHDIGKGRNPLYFGENQKGENRHDTLAPAMSATIIKRHVTDGLEMARHYRLPRQVADAIPQHHGTRVVGYFLHKAIQEAQGRPELPRVDEEVFRYPGPKPQSREAALVMISDAVEASCRALPEPTPPRLQAQVQKMINSVFGEGQLDECDLTLKDLHLIADSFSRTLQGIYHSRPEYPAAPAGPVRPDPLPAVPEPLPAAAAPRPTGSV